MCVRGQGVHEANGARPPRRKICRQEPAAPSRAFVDAILDWSPVTPFVGRRFAVALRSAVVGAVSGTLVRLSSPPRCPSFLLYSSIVTLSCPCLPSPPPPPEPLPRKASRLRCVFVLGRSPFVSVATPRRRVGSPSRPLSRRDLMMRFSRRGSGGRRARRGARARLRRPRQSRSLSSEVGTRVAAARHCSPPELLRPFSLLFSL